MQRFIFDPIAVDAHAALLHVALGFRAGGHQARLAQQLQDAHRRAANVHFGHVFGNGAVTEARLERGQRVVRRLGGMEAGDDFLSQHDFRIAGVAATIRLLLESGDVFQRTEGQQFKVPPHQRVGNRHELAEHRIGRLRNTDVVALGLGHFLDAVRTHQQRHRQNALGLLAIFLLQLAAHQQVEFLIGAPQLQIGLQRHGVIALHQGIQELVHRNRDAALEPLGEVFAFHHAGHRIARGQLDHAARAQGIAPFGVVTDLGACRIQHQAGLRVVGLGVGLDLFAGQRRAGAVAAAGVADGGREIANQEDDVVPQVLQLAHLVQHHRMAQVDVRRGGVQPQLDAQRHASRAALGQLASELGLNQQFVAAALGYTQIGFDFRRNRGFRGRHGRGTKAASADKKV
ncbi:hypothetical protein D3C73_806880 [compost metagenome]